uniref:Uncharacterized protein n=1 Tax=Acrobeloides nanus TaxID=290746 RepID=A0A914DWA3_9BILA
MIYKMTIFTILLFIEFIIVEGQECDCNYNAHCRTGSAFWCTSRNTCSGNCVGVGEWAYCRPNQWRCNTNSAAPYGSRNTWQNNGWGSSYGGYGSSYYGKRK